MTVSQPPALPLSASDPGLAPWRAFLQAHARISRRLDEELRAEHDLSLAEYDALLTVARSPERRIRMRALADQVLLSKSGVTRLIDRLVADGLVERGTCLADARGAEAILTPIGFDRLRAASGTHLRGVRAHFLAVVDPADLPSVERSMLAVSAHSCSGPDGDPCDMATSAVSDRTDRPFGATGTVDEPADR
ncbi:MAG: winged helix-turn-helix transcriptional regulator [Chloroflexi bacterium]|nr:winged helix-turn-helix transcriptional regulator [Chloroflexota bacterium]